MQQGKPVVRITTVNPAGTRIAFQVVARQGKLFREDEIVAAGSTHENMIAALERAREMMGEMLEL